MCCCVADLSAIAHRVARERERERERIAVSAVVVVVVAPREKGPKPGVFKYANSTVAFKSAKNSLYETVRSTAEHTANFPLLDLLLHGLLGGETKPPKLLRETPIPSICE